MSTISPHLLFSSPTTDLILRSSDNVDFYVQRVVLSLASPVFADMLSLPLPKAETVEPGATVVQMAESSASLERLLRLFYPGATPLLAKSALELCETLELALGKYDMQHLVPLAQMHAARFLHSDPFDVFAIASHFNWANIARQAARACLTHPLRESLYDLSAAWSFVPAKKLHALLQYHYRCGQVFVSVAKDMELLPIPDHTKERHCPVPSCLVWVKPPHTQRWIRDVVSKIANTYTRTPGTARNDAQFAATLLGKLSTCEHCRFRQADALEKVLASQWWPKAQAGIDSVVLEL